MKIFESILKQIYKNKSIYEIYLIICSNQILYLLNKIVSVIILLCEFILYGLILNILGFLFQIIIKCFKLFKDFYKNIIPYECKYTYKHISTNRTKFIEILKEKINKQ